MSPDKYKDIVNQAEKAVAAVSDPALKQIAFQKILDDLLDSLHPEAKASTRLKSKRGASKAGGTGRKSKRGPKQYIQQLIDDGFFKKPKIISEVSTELATGGHHLTSTAIAVALLRFCKKRVLRRSKVKGAEKGNTYAYSVW